MVRIANENMANAIRIVTVEQGIDPRDFALVAMGGAGPTHAAEIADAIGMRRVLVPAEPWASPRPSARWPRPLGSTRCAASTSLDARVTAAELAGLFAELEARAAADFEAQSGGRSPSDRPPLRGAALPGPELRAGGRRAGRRALLRGAGRSLRGLRPALRGLLRLPARRHPDRARPAVGGRAGRGARARATLCTAGSAGDDASVPPRPVFFPGHDFVETAGRPPLDACAGAPSSTGRSSSRRWTRRSSCRPAGRSPSWRTACSR